MTTFKRVILFYFIGLILILCLPFITGRGLIATLRAPGFWILPAVFSLAGYLVGAVVYELMVRPAKKKARIYFITHCLGILGLVALIVVQFINVRESEANRISENNHRIMKYDVHDDEEYIRLAFRRLESEFEDPNDFELDAFAVHTQDTTYDLLPYKAYTVYFTYFLNKEKEKKFFSKLVVVKDTTVLLLYNADTRTNEEYINKKAEWKKQESETFESINKSFREMPDSVKNAMIDTLREILKP